MKLWHGFGSEHSMNLVMIGRFKEARDADQTKELIDQLVEHATAELSDASDVSAQGHRFSEAMLDLLRTSKLYSLGSAELEQFAYDANVRAEGNEVVVTTDEVDVSAFLKVLLDRGARVEVYSAHEYPDTSHGRGG